MTIYVAVADFPGGALAPARACRVHADCYELLDSSSDPEHHRWEFGKGDIVRCENRPFAPGETALVAVERCTCDVC